MARTIRIGDIGDYANNQMEKLLRAAVLETELLLKMASPVDTGRFRASWATGENTAGSYDGGEQQPATGQYKDATSPPKDPSLERRISIGYQSGQERIGNVYSVHNNLPYAEKLANGKLARVVASRPAALAGCKASLKTCKVECEKQPTRLVENS
jgi:hypothetical protein